MDSNGPDDFMYFVEHGPDIVCRVSPELVYTYVSPQCVSILGWQPDEMIGRDFLSFVHPEDAPVLMEVLRQVEEEGVYPAPPQLRTGTRGGDWIWLEVNGRIIFNEDASIKERFVTMRDITERKLEELRLAELAMTDGMTGLLNRRAFDEEMDREWRRTLREGSQMSLLLLDVDHFKDFNDLYGHQMGDDCLRTVATAVRAACQRPTDRVARYGGEEFAVILPQLDVTSAATVAEHIRADIEALAITHEGNPEGGARVTVSIGVATALSRVGGRMRMPESLLVAADAALYRAKHGGRNSVAISQLMASKEMQAAR